MPDYQKSKIYKLWSPSKNIVYIGSTTEPLATRLSKHNYNYKVYNKDNTKGYCISYLILDCEDYKIELLEQYPCNNKTQLLKKEGEHIRNNECVNKIIAGRTIKEWYKDNIDKIKEYRLTNTDKMKEYKKQYRLDNIDSIKEKAKQYRIDNKDKLKEQSKKYYEANKEKWIKKK